MTLKEILQNAQGGRAVANLAAEVGLAPEKAEAATQAMIPDFSAALQQLKGNPAALGGLIAELARGGHEQSFVDPGPPPEARGANAALEVFGSAEAIRHVAERAAKASGAPLAAVEAMLPALASVLLGGMAHSMASRGQGAALVDLAGAASSPGGLGAALSASGGSGGGLMGMLGAIFGGAHQPDDPKAAALVAGLATLSAMFAAGAVASQGASLGALASSFNPPPQT